MFLLSLDHSPLVASVLLSTKSWKTTACKITCTTITSLWHFPPKCLYFKAYENNQNLYPIPRGVSKIKNGRGGPRRHTHASEQTKPYLHPEPYRRPPETLCQSACISRHIKTFKISASLPPQRLYFKANQNLQNLCITTCRAHQNIQNLSLWYFPPERVYFKAYQNIQNLCISTPTAPAF